MDILSCHNRLVISACATAADNAADNDDDDDDNDDNDHVLVQAKETDSDKLISKFQQLQVSETVRKFICST